MANYLNPPKDLKLCTKQDLEDFIEVSNQKFKFSLFGEGKNSDLNESCISSDGKYYWPSNGDFSNYILGLTNTNDIRSASNVLYQNVTQAPEYSEWTTTPSPERPAPANMPTDLKEKIKTAEKTSAELKQTQVQASAEVQTAIDRQKEIYAEEIQKAKDLETALKDKKIYYKVEKPPIEETQEVKNLKAQAVADSRKFIGDTADEFQKNPNLTNQSPDEAKLAAEQAAVTTYETLTNNSPSFQIAIATNIAANSDLLKRISPDVEMQASFKNALETFIEQKRAEVELAGHFINLSKIEGTTNFENLNIKFSEVPQEGYQEFDPISSHLENLNQQSSVLNNILNLRELGEHEIKSQFLSAAGSRLENYIATLPTESFLSQAYNHELVHLGLASVGLAEITPWVAAEGSLLGKIVVGSGFGPVAGFIQAKTGIDLGVKIAVKAVASKVAGTAAGEAVAGAAAAGAVAGSVVPIAGTIAGFVAGLVGPKVIGWVKDNAPKFGKYIVGLVGAVFGFVIGGRSILGAVIGAGVGYGGATVISGGLSGLGSSLTSLGSGIAGFFGTIGGAFIGSVATPILITLLGFPVAVALILFIINSGAYVVPPGSLTGTIGINCNTSLNGGPTSQIGSPAANDAICIVSYLNQASLNPLLVDLLNTPAWQSLAKVLPAPALGALASSAPVDGHLQCVGFASATAGFAYGQAFSQIDACSYIDNPPAGYTYVAGTSGIASGDFFLINGSGGCDVNSPGHMGVVVSVDGALITCADANYTEPGYARTSHGCFALAQLTGYLRKQ